MNLPWWGWSAVSVAGFAGTALICTRLTASGMSSIAVNVYLFGLGLGVFLLSALWTKAELSLPLENIGWLAGLAVTVFISNYAVVTAYGSAPNAGLVKAIGTLDLVAVALVVAFATSLRDGSFGLSRMKLAGMALCLLGAVLVALESKSE